MHFGASKMGCRFHRFNPCVWSRLFGLRLTCESSDMTCHGVVASHPFAESLSKGTQFKPVPEAIHFRLAAKTPLGSPRGERLRAGRRDHEFRFMAVPCCAIDSQDPHSFVIVPCGEYTKNDGKSPFYSLKSPFSTGH